MDMKSILRLEKSLPNEDRRVLVDELILVTPEDDEPLFSAADLAEFKRRSDELEAHPERGLTWEQVKSKLKLPKS